MQNTANTEKTDHIEPQTGSDARVSDESHVLGVYALSQDSRTGIGGTKKRYAQETLWFVRRINDDDYCVQPLNANSIPSGPITTLTKGEFLRSYQPRPGYYEKRCLPFLESLKKKIATADKYLDAGELDTAEKEFVKALLLDEKHPKANVELGKISLEKGDGKKLASAMRRILGIDALFQEQERHLFNTFAIALRKGKRFAEAITLYEQALSRNADDENLHFNMARALAEGGDIPAAQGHLRQALALRPDFAEARRFLAHLDEPDADAGDDAARDKGAA